MSFFYLQLKYLYFNCNRKDPPTQHSPPRYEFFMMHLLTITISVSKEFMLETIFLLAKICMLFLALLGGAFVTWLAIVVLLLVIHYGMEVFPTLKKMWVAKYSTKNTIKTLSGNKSNK